MGMFDNLYDQRGAEWQTKSFRRSNFDKYRITYEGHLEIGKPLDLPLRYFDDHRELFALLNRLFKCSARWAWTKHDFSGPIHASAFGSDGEPREATFEFQGGILIYADPPGVSR